MFLPAHSHKKATSNAAPLRRVVLSLALLALCLGLGCTSPKATQKAPELPPRHWLDEAPGVPVEKKEKLEAALPNLYDPQKLFGFEDFVYLTIQQSPLLVNSAVELEIKKVQLTNAIWQYLPEPRVGLQVSSNLTQYNQGMVGTSSSYGEIRPRLNFYAQFPNPLATYFNHQVQKALVNVAISTHRKAIGSAIHDIAEIYYKLEAQRRITEVQKGMLPIAKQLTSFWKQTEAADGRQGVSLDLAKQREREVELRLEKAEIQTSMLRTKLKIMAGVELEQRLNLNTKDAESILHDFDGTKLSWEERWSSCEDELLVRAQVKLQDFQIMVAWAKYVPDLSIQVNNYPPAGQYQPVQGREDTFVHLNFDFPLIDWGSRYRGVQTARMLKAKAFQEQARVRTRYSNSWTEAQQRVNLAATSLKIAQNTLDVATMEAKEADINFREGLTPFPDLASKQQGLINANISHIQAVLDYKLAQLDWMYLAGVLQERYLGLPAKEIL